MLSPIVRLLFRYVLGLYRWVALRVLSLRRRLSGASGTAAEILNHATWKRFLLRPR